MRSVLLENAKPGDEVAKPVVNDRGMVILSKGTKLSMSLIDRLQKMGVVEVVLEGDDPNAPPPKSLEEMLDELEVRFEGLEGNPMMMEIMKIARRHMLDREAS